MINLSIVTPNIPSINSKKCHAPAVKNVDVPINTLLPKPIGSQNNCNIKRLIGKILSLTGITKQLEPLSAADLETIFGYITRDCQNKDAKNWTNDGLPENQKKIQSVIKKSSLNRDTILYRGIKPGEINNKSIINFSQTDGIPIDDFLKMKEYTSPGFSSSTLSKRVATWFQLQNNFIFEIEAPKGTPCFDVGAHSRLFKKLAKAKGVNALFLREKEVILPLGIKYEIKGFKRIDKYLVACLKIIK